MFRRLAMARRSARLKAPFLKRVWLDDAPANRASYPFSVPLFADGFELGLRSAVTIIAGENGSGKSTLIEAISHHSGFNVRGGNRNQGLVEDADVGPLARELRFAWLPKITKGFFLRAESFFDFAGYIDALDGPALDPYGGRSLHEQSHGEAFLSLFANRFGSPGLYILDEPEAALSPQRQLMLLRILHDLAEEGLSQVIMATHSPILMALPCADLLYIRGASLERMDWRLTPHTRLYSRFLAEPDQFLGEIFRKSEPPESPRD